MQSSTSDSRSAGFALLVLFGFPICAVWSAGCNGKVPGRPDVYQVRGVVTRQGKPVEKATVQVWPEDTTLPPAYGLTDQDGNFSLQTFEPEDGAVPGKHRVTVYQMLVSASPYREGDPRFVMPPPPKALIPEKYFDPKTSGLQTTVAENNDNRLDIDLAD